LSPTKSSPGSWFRAWGDFHRVVFSKEEETKRRLFVTLALGAAILGGLGWAALHPGPAVAQNQDQQEGSIVGSTYLTTNKDSSGNFASRSVISFHGDGTMSVTDSGQGGPFFFSSQLGAWKSTGDHQIVARTIDFDYPPNADVARLDYTASFQGSQVTGRSCSRPSRSKGIPWAGAERSLEHSPSSGSV
jgi:hypothetical protein